MGDILDNFQKAKTGKPYGSDFLNTSPYSLTQEACVDCFDNPELGYKNDKLKRDTEAVDKFVESDAFTKLMESLDEQDRAAKEDVEQFLRDIKAEDQIRKVRKEMKEVKLGQIIVDSYGISKVTKLEDFGGYTAEQIIPKEIFIEAFQKFIEPQAESDGHMKMKIWITTYWTTEIEPVVTPFDNQEAAETCARYYKRQGYKVCINECNIFHKCTEQAEDEE